MRIKISAALCAVLLLVCTITCSAAIVPRNAAPAHPCCPQKPAPNSSSCQRLVFALESVAHAAPLLDAGWFVAVEALAAPADPAPHSFLSMAHSGPSADEPLYLFEASLRI